jgi:hypothetical protein
MKALVNNFKAVITIILITAILQVNAQNINSKASQSFTNFNVRSYYQNPGNYSSNSPVDFINKIQGNINSLKVYPNPATDKITIDLVRNNAGVINYEIYNLAGKIIASDKIPSSNSQATVNTNNLPDGIYLLSVIYDNRRINSKIVINHK